MAFNKNLAKRIATAVAQNKDERGLVDGFVDICDYLSPDPEKMLSWRGAKPSLANNEGLSLLATKYFAGYRKSDFPAEPGTVPDEMVSIILRLANGYTKAQTEEMKIEHQHAMCAENSVGALLERYLESKLRKSGWRWCCGEFVAAVDFIKFDGKKWHALQIKNRDNSENSSSNKVRAGTEIQKWYRTVSKSGKTRWDKLPPLMQGYGLSEEGFVAFVESYLKTELALRSNAGKN